MKISILLTILLIIISLGGAFLPGGKLCLFGRMQTDPGHGLYHRAVKLMMRTFYLLNTVALDSTLKGDKTLLIQPQNHKFDG